MKKWVLRIVVVCVVLVIVALAMVFFNLNSIVKKGVETVGPQLTKVEVRLNSATLSPMNGNGELNQLFVGNPEGYKTESAIKVGNIKVAVKLRSVLSDTIVVDVHCLEQARAVSNVPHRFGLSIASNHSLLNDLPQLRSTTRTSFDLGGPSSSSLAATTGRFHF